MVNAQEWLDQWYPKEGECLRKNESEDIDNFNKKRSEIEHLYIENQKLEGSLDLSDFSSLERLYCSNNQLTSLNLSNCKELAVLKCASSPNLTNLDLDLDLDNCKKLGSSNYGSLICNKNQLKEGLDLSKFPELKEDKIHWSTRAQTWLDENYPVAGVCQIEPKYSFQENNKGKTRKEIIKLDFGSQYLEGSLSLDGFDNLKELNCNSNCLVELTLNDCLQLEEINCGYNNISVLKLDQVPALNSLICFGNSLSNLDFLTTLVYLEKLEDLDIRSNNFTTDLVWLTPLVNLKKLKLANNNFLGSLEPLQNLTKLWNLGIENTNLNSGVEYLPESLYYFYYNEYNSNPNYKVLEIKEQLDNKYWRDIHKEFQPKDKKAWIEQGFTKEQTKQFFQEWNKNIELIKPDSAKFLNWYLNIKKLDREWALANEEEFRELRDSYSSFGTCEECQQTNTSRGWCQSCNAQHFQAEFNNWTSGNFQIDNFIKKCQLEATSSWNVLEWIPYEQFTNTEHLAQGGFGKVEKAEWKEGVIKKWSNKEKKWERRGDYESYDKYKDYQTVALKTLSNSNDLDKDFLPELMLYKMFKSEVSQMVPCYGISQNPQTKEYIMVMKFMKEGNLKEYLKKNYQNIEPKDKLYFLRQIITGLKDIHRKGLVHQDFHSGNIIVGGKSCRITDLGLCQPVNETNNEKVFGVMPYVAPEVLCNKPYTQASDIYSLGMIMYELFTDYPPFYQEEHDANLALKICQGVRPKFPVQIKYPQLLIDLITSCWDNEPNNRPTSREISQMINGWVNEYSQLKENTPFYQQYQETEEHNKSLPEEIKYPNYQAKGVWHSKLINTKQITQLLQKSEINKEYHTKSLEQLTLDNFNLDELNIQEESSYQTNIEIPPK